MALDGSDDTNVTNTDVGENALFGWAPDASAIAYAVPSKDERRLAIVEMNGRQPIGAPRIRPAAGVVWSPIVWSPDATMLLVARAVEGQPTADGTKTYSSTIQMIDRDLSQGPVTIASHPNQVSSLSWQWLAP